MRGLCRVLHRSWCPHLRKGYWIWLCFQAFLHGFYWLFNRLFHSPWTQWSPGDCRVETCPWGWICSIAVDLTFDPRSLFLFWAYISNNLPVEDLVARKSRHVDFPIKLISHDEFFYWILHGWRGDGEILELKRLPINMG